MKRITLGLVVGALALAALLTVLVRRERLFAQQRQALYAVQQAPNDPSYRPPQNPGEPWLAPANNPNNAPSWNEPGSRYAPLPGNPPPANPYGPPPPSGLATVPGYPYAANPYLNTPFPTPPMIAHAPQPPNPKSIEEERQVQVLLAEYQGTKDEDKRVQLVQQLTTLVTHQFEDKQMARERELQQLEERLNELKEKHAKREAMKDKIVNDRVQQLVNNIDGLGWGVDPGYPTPFAPSLSPISTAAPGFPAKASSGFGQQPLLIPTAPGAAARAGAAPAPGVVRSTGVGRAETLSTAPAASVPARIAPSTSLSPELGPSSSALPDPSSGNPDDGVPSVDK